MQTRVMRPLLAAAFVLLCVWSVDAAGARFWQVATQSDFLKGDAENLAIDQFGRVTLGPELTPLGSGTSPFIWALVAGPDGTLFAGTGNDGQVYRFKPDGTRTVFFDAPELEVHALAPAPGGGLYVGTSPDGKIYKVDKDGRSTVYFDPDDKYIWSLVVDKDGVLYAGTGEKGVIYKITAQGKGDVFYRTKSTHALTLLLDPRGDLIAGTQSPAKVIRIAKNGTGFVVLDTPLDEITALRFDDRGVLYAAAQSGRPSPEPSRSPDRTPDDQDRSAPVPSVSTEITAVTIVDMSGTATGTSGSGREERRGMRGAIYRILSDGTSDQLWQSSDDAPYDLLPDGDGSLLIATGSKGKIYRLTGDPVRVTLVAKADAQQVTAFVREIKGPIWFATSNPGRVFRLSAGQATRGTFVSDVRDADTVATWGAISWRGSVPAGSAAKLYTRSGNTKVPDDTWSPWSAAYTKQSGEQIASPKARYLQFKLELTGSQGATPLITSVSVAYLQRNLRPEVNTITVHPPGVVFQKPFSTGDAEIAGFDGTMADRRPGVGASATPGLAGSTPPMGRRSYQKGLQTFTWRADDDNDDDLQYDVLYRREGDTTWKPLKRNLDDPIFVWDTTSVPNGTYVIKVVASDAAENSPGTALTGERESRAFDVDNAPPDITVTSVRRDGGRTVVEFTVKDDFSAVQRVEYSLDADRWRTIYPKDGIADSPSEEFELSIDGDTSERAIILRAADAMNNVATARAEVTPKR